MVKTWQVGILTFMICSGVLTILGLLIIYVMYLKHKKSKTLNVERLRKQYKSEWDALV